ncbi:alginate lyase family protein [Lunatimonas salinarum]|uniref:alginate lyase family protein n=1 Tax=Lunatimonas salinarum TaxID=1774590 RepID=UPI001FD7EC48|nr:alginate lyase family protein [Lunatimonas salinarum]
MLFSNLLRGYCATIILLLSSAMLLNAQGMHPAAQISYVKAQLKEGREPYFSAYKQLLAYADSALTQQHHALADFAVPGFYVDPEGHRTNSKSLQTDSFHAYATALAYVLSGKRKYAKKAVYFLNAWATTNTRYSQADGPLVMAYSGPGLVIAAQLLKDAGQLSGKELQRVERWVGEVYRVACNEIRNRKNNWADWGRYGSVLSAAFLEDSGEMAENIRLIQSDLHHKIAPDGHMPEEVRRQDRGLWYTYFSLAPITAACWVIRQTEGTDLLRGRGTGPTIQSGIDYLLRFVINPESWPWYANQRPGSPDSWPGNLMEAMEGIYEQAEYGTYAAEARPIVYPIHHFAWTFPTLMKPRLTY